MDPISAAIRYADRSEHEGAGYTLMVHTTDGQKVEVDVHKVTGPKTGVEVHLFRKRAINSVDDRIETFFNPNNVTKVEVLW
ncbi:MAG: hypothetical protein EOQ44_25125 [Mesorhizobium sp.]|uniref:hypothetical protein n=1 Tax=Mesorhizobium sp. TaxID=1871066 RepID=UPI000FE55D20|nr:hypothetical protein [Mesorhizobium sp.]RWB40428.1 MAG: hypothetical protein EOQ44_25125 [Mesorhizobium sp.]